MNKINFKNKQVNKNFVITLIFVGISIITLFYIINIIDYSLIKKTTIEQTVNNYIDYNIDNIKIDNNYLAISGWALISGEKPHNFDIDVILLNIDSYEAIVIPTILRSRSDLDGIIDDGINYSESGFVSRVYKNLINLDEYDYKIYIRYVTENEVFIIQTENFLNR
jgi:hypothetical protein